MRNEFLGGSNDDLAVRMLDELLLAKALKVDDGLIKATMRA
jgi:hypothetical protein